MLGIDIRAPFITTIAESSFQYIQVPFLASREVQPSFPALAFANAVIAASRVRFVAARNSKNGARAAILGKRRVLG